MRGKKWMKWVFWGTAVVSVVLTVNRKAMASATSTELPKLPTMGKQLSDFVPEGWTLMDSVTLDFNKDGVMDFVGVLEYQTNSDPEAESLTLSFYPRILFAAASDSESQYHLDFTDENLILTSLEGGTFGDPYEPMTVEGQSFTTHSYGGSSWKWSEAYTYTYQDGTWYLTASDLMNNYMGYVTDHSINDYVKGTGIRHKRSSDLEEIEKNLLDDDWDNQSFDLIYTVSLDPPMTIYQAGMSRFLLSDWQTEWPVESIRFAEGIDQKTAVKLPQDQVYFDYQNEDYLLYSYMGSNGDHWYLALYSRNDQTLFVCRQEETSMRNVILYKGTIYYTTEIVKTVSYTDHKGNICQSDVQVGEKLNSIVMDGTSLRELYSYRLPEWEDISKEKAPPYLFLSTEISGDEIFIEVYIEGRPHPFYRMNLDGSGVQMIGVVP